MSNTVNLEINGKPLKAELGEMIIEVADKAGETIPRFCYHKKLKIAANCRMCLVELEGGRKPMPACATPVTEGMKVYTKSPKALEYQKTVMEFLLANHPLDCPVCDQGGECELQDNAMAYGKDSSRFNLEKRAVADKNIGPLIATELTRCIHCTRCVRFGIEVAGEPELGMTERGGHSEIATFLEQSVSNELSGNIIDLCPVGALTNKDARFKARPWELTQHPAIAGHDCVGSNIFVHERRGTGIRIVPRENESLNETWLSDRDRYSIAGLRSSDRLTQPMIKNRKTGEWAVVDWTVALEAVVVGLNKVLKKETSQSDADEQIGLLLSPNSTIEEAYLAQKWMRSFGADQIDFRLRHQSFEIFSERLTGLNCTMNDISTADVIFCFGGNIRKDQPIIHQRIRFASRYGAKIAVMNPADFDFRMKKKEKTVLVEIHELPERLAGILKIIVDKLAAEEKLKPGLAALLSGVYSHPENQEIADWLLSAKSPVILSGLIAEQHPESALIQVLQQTLMTLLNAKGGMLTNGANTQGCYLAGAFSSTKNAGEMLKKGLSAYLLMGVEPEWDTAYGSLALENLQKADFVVSFNAFASESMKGYCDVLLPIHTYFETEGTFVNATGEWQTFEAACKGPGQSKSLWKVIRVLANLIEVKGFDFESLDQVRTELRRVIESRLHTEIPPLKLSKKFAQFSALKPGEVRCCSLIPMYQVDGLVRRSSPLHETQDALLGAHMRISDALAAKLGVETGDSVMVTQQVEGQKNVARFFVEVGGVADHTVILPMGLEESLPMREAYGNVWVQKG
jgi:NADH-quinone oxidoreductase subunit G